MQARNVLARYCEQAEGIMGAEILLDEEGKARKVLERAQILRMDAGAIEGLTVMRDMLIGMAQRPPQPLELQRAQLLSGGALDGLGT